ncbi:MAG TPA: SLBB domain-containing protein [Rubrivivax sp.]|nr:SLBB domain-containing protein [Rubrivivax sp.]
MPRRLPRLGAAVAALKAWRRLAPAVLAAGAACSAFGQIAPSSAFGQAAQSSATPAATPPPPAAELMPGTGQEAAASVQLRQAAAATQPGAGSPSSAARIDPRDGIDPRIIELSLPKPSEFEEYVNRLAFPNELARPDLPLAIRRLGTGLITAQNIGGEAVDYSPLVPPEYLVSAGDEIVLSIWGSVDAELRLVVDKSGRISVPRVGTIMVSGVRYADLPATISQRVARTFKNFQLSVSLGQLRGVRVFVTGFAVRPGAYTVNALSSIANAVVRAGGPSASGSFRNIQLRRGNTVVSTLDFYDLLLNGDRSADKLIQAGDVVHVGPIGMQVGVIGSVNRPAVFELKPGETMDDALRMAGGFAAVADSSRLAVERIDERTTVRVIQVDVAQAGTTPLRNGDVLRAFNVVTLAASQQRQNKRVRVEGEVLHPGDYVLPARSSIDDAIRAAGGMTTGAFVFGTEFTRESVRLTQQENYERALRSLETELQLASSTQRITSRDEAAAQAGRSAATTQLIERLRTIKPTGRVVLQIPPESRDLPNLVLEDGDRLFVPPVPTSVGVFGSVFNAGNYLREDGRTLADYLRQAGGPKRGADAGSSFVLRANGTVVSNLQERSWGSGLSANFEGLPALPGDTLFVPEELDKTTFVQHAKDWTQILAQFALGVAAFVTLTNN